MMYQENNNLSTKNSRRFGRGGQFPIPNQQGVTLLLAILVLASILAISFSLATILFIEVRTSGDLLRTEPSLYGAQALTEEAIYKVKRKLSTYQVNYSTQLGNVILNSPSPLESSTTTPIFQTSVNPGTDFHNTPNRYPIYDSTNLDPIAGSQYGKVKISYLTTGNNYPLSVYICQFNPDPETPPDFYLNPPPCSDPADSQYWLVRAYTLDEGESTSWNLNPNYQQEIILFNSGSSSKIYAQIEGFGPASGYEPKGIPFVGEVSVEVNAEFGGVSRRIKAIIPKN